MATWYVNGTTGADTDDGKWAVPLAPGYGPFATIAAALTASAAYDVIYIAGGVYDAPNTTGWAITKSLTIIGEGAGNSTTLGTILRRTDATSGPVLDIQVTGGTTMNGLTLRGFRIQRQTTASSFTSGDYGIKCALTATSSTKLTNLLIDQVTIVGMRDTGIYMAGNTASDTFFIFPRFLNVTVQECYQRGVYFFDSAFSGEGSSILLYMESCYVKDNQLEGVIIHECLAGTIINCAFENNCLDDASIDTSLGGQVRLRTSHNMSFIGCDFENFTNASQTRAKKALVNENGRALYVQNCNFANASAADEDGTQRCIKIYTGSAADMHCFIGPCSVDTTSNFLEVVGDASKVIYTEPFVFSGTIPANTITGKAKRLPWR